MAENLINLKEYGVFTFSSTSHALKAERVLKNASAEFLIIPTPRQISTSCGLAVKVTLDNITPDQIILLDNQVEIDAVYRSTIAVNGKAHIERVNNG